MTTHYIEEAEAIADRVAVINQGEIIVIDKTDELLKKMGHKKLTINLQNDLNIVPDSLRTYNLEIGDDKKSVNYIYNVNAESTGITNLLKDLKNIKHMLSQFNQKQVI